MLERAVLRSEKDDLKSERAPKKTVLKNMEVGLQTVAHSPLSILEVEIKAEAALLYTPLRGGLKGQPPPLQLVMKTQDF